MLSYLHFFRSLVVLISIMVLSACATSSYNIEAIDASLSLNEQLQIVADDAVASGLPGVSLHVQYRDKSIDVVAGVINLKTAEPVSASSLFHVASSGKAFMSTMFMRFVDKGILQLDDPIDRWLDPSISSLITNSDKITVEMLLAHTSGIRDYVVVPIHGDHLVESPEKKWTPIEVLGYIANTKNHFKPDAKFRYSNTNYVLLGAIAEGITDVPLGSALRKWVFEPAGLENTYGTYEKLDQAEIAHGYLPAKLVRNSGLNIELPADGSDLDTIEWIKTNGLGDAPIHSTPSDLNSFIRTLVDTDILVSGELKTKMLTESFHRSSEYGLGMSITDNGMSFQHSGGFYGVYSEMAYTPSEDLSFATNVNASHGNYEALYVQYITRLSLVLDRRR